jgi:hypothetical protein
MSNQVPSPTTEERGAPGYNAVAWSYQNGVCSYHGGEHEFVGKPYCRLCRQDWAWLKARAKNGVIYSAD